MTSHSRSLKRWTAMLSMVLAALIAGMAYLLWQDVQRTVGSQQPSAEVSSIRIQREMFDDIVMLKDQGKWKIESPCRAPVNEQRLMPLLSALEPGGHQYPAGQVDLQAAGLENPLATVYLDELEHRIGNADLNGERRYLQRGTSVEFIPEWVLSLINGGVTALVQLNVFAMELSGLTITDSEGVIVEYSSDEELGIWQNLSAQQMVTWPIADTPVAYSLSLTATSDQGNKLQLTVFETERFTAIKPDDADCAYILEPDALPQ